jgi:hypothetical protein
MLSVDIFPWYTDGSKLATESFYYKSDASLASVDTKSVRDTLLAIELAIAAICFSQHTRTSPAPFICVIKRHGILMALQPKNVEDFAG